ncbi:hypothetical protein AAVH_18963, partial [Aphelenchoides avenae]
MSHIVGGGYSIFNWLITSIDASASLLQIYVVYLIVYASPSAMRQYRSYLALISFWDLVFTLSLLLLTPDMLYPSSCTVVNGLAGLAGRNSSLLA